jgi:hypothetical protein
MLELKQRIAGIHPEQHLHRSELPGAQARVLSLDVAQHLRLRFALLHPGHHLGFDGRK